MSDTLPDLEILRRRIDEIDDRLQDLLIERIEIVSRVADHKQRSGGVAPHQPAREAEILRRLVARNRGAMPPASLVRIWRELLAATTRMQGSFTVAVHVPPAGPGFWDIARDHYGSHTPMLIFGSTGQVIRAVAEGRATVGVLPMPQEEEADPWWRHLLSTRDAAPHVIARLPFAGRGNARFDGGDALAIGRGAQLATGRDRTLIATENAPNISRGRLFSILTGIDLRCTFIASGIASSEQGEGGNMLIEIDDFVPADDPRLDRFRAQLGAALFRLLPLGGYAVPLSAAELSQSGDAANAGTAAAPAPPRGAEAMTNPTAPATAPVPGPGILDIAPYIGGEAKAEGVARPIRLASNESALGPSPKAVAAYRALAGDIHRYPDGSAIELREALGRAHALDPARIVCGSGSDELIGMLLRAYAGPGTEVLYSRHGFLMYPIGALSVGAAPVAAPERELTADVDALLERVTERTRIVFIANPNNPTGTYLPISEMRRLHAGLPPHVLLAIDAAYAEFVNRNDFEPGTSLVDRADNVVMLRTFSKIYALAGLRLGWAYCPPAIADVLNRIRGPFNVTAPALAAGIAAVEDSEALRRAQAHNERWLPWFSERLAALGLPLTPSVANFVLPRFPDDPLRNADAAFAFLQWCGILVRKMAGYGLPQHLRITIGTGEEMEAVAAAFAEFMGRE